MNKPFICLKDETFLLTVTFLIGFCLFAFLRLPLFAADYWFSKWVVAYIFIAFFTIFLGIKNKKILLPFLPRNIIVGGYSLLLIAGCNFFYHGLPFFSSAFWDRLCFILLTISFYNIFKNHSSLVKNFLGCLFIANGFFLISILPDLYSVLSQASYTKAILQHSFGNINMSAEFVGICLILMMSGRAHFIRFSFLIDLFICLSIIYCYYTASRSIAVAVLITLCVLMLKNISFKKIALYVISSLLIVGVIKLISNNYNSLNSISSVVLFPAYQKPSSTFSRWQIIEGTLHLIKDYPWGIGAGNYLFSFIPYLHYAIPPFNENHIVQSPHNEYLRITAEEGLLFVSVLLGVILVYLYNVRKQLSYLMSQHPTIIAFFIFLSVQAAFQFPFINGFPFFMTAGFLGYTLSILHKEGGGIKSSTWLLVSSFTTAMLIGGMTSYTLSFFYPQSAFATKLAYSLNRENWQAAVFSAKAEMYEGNIEQANQIIDQELHLHPHNYIALSVKAQLEAKSQHEEKGCTILKQIDGYFLNQSQYHSYIMEHCQK